MHINIIKGGSGLQPVIIIREHIGGKDVGIAVIIHIRHIGSHGRMTHMLHPLLQFILKGTVPLIDIQVIPFKKIIGDIYIRVVISIQVAYGNTQAKADQAAVDAGFFTYISKFSVVVPEQVIATTFQKIGNGPVSSPEVSLIGIVQCIDRDKTVVDNKAIQIPICIIIKKSGMGGIASFIGQSVFFRFICKTEILIIDKKLATGFCPINIPGITYKNIEPAILIDIHHHHTGAPVFLINKACFC